MAYMTKQQQAVLACIRGCADGIGTAELTELLHRQGETVGLTTVYRQLERLEKAGKVHKLVTDTGAKYQFCTCADSGRDCFLLKCETCGTVQHVDCSHLAPLYRHLEEEHGFAIDAHRTLFYGVCRRCREAAE